MAINAVQLLEYVVKPVLMLVGNCTLAEQQLVMGTCAQESYLGTYVAQLGIGLDGGIGIYQMELPTYTWLYSKQIEPSAAMRAKVKLYLGYEGKPLAHRMVTDLALATLMCRLLYKCYEEPLPEANDIAALALYWKRYYNTSKGKGTPEQFINNYERYCADVFAGQQMSKV